MHDLDCMAFALCNHDVILLKIVSLSAYLYLVLQHFSLLLLKRLTSLTWQVTNNGRQSFSFLRPGSHMSAIIADKGFAMLAICVNISCKSPHRR